MSNTLIKTIKMPLREPTNRKEKRIKQCMEETLKVQQKVSDFMWSVPKYRWEKATDSVWFRLVRSNIDHNLPAHSAYQASYKVRESFASYRSNGYQGRKPKFTGKDHIFFDHSQPRFDKSPSGNYTTRLTLNTNANKDECSGWGTTEWFVLNIGEYQKDFLDDYFNDKNDIGCAKLIDKGKRYELHQVFKKELEEVKKPEYIVGVDLGRNNVASVAVIDRDGNKVTAFPPIKGRELEEHRNTLNRIRKSRQQKDSDYHKKISNKEEAFVNQKNHEYSKQIIDDIRDRLGEFATYKVAMEDLTNLRKNVTEKHQQGKYRNRKEIRLVNSWPYADFKDKLEYKVLEDAHTEVEDVDAAYTSQTCSDCGSRDTVRNSTRFKCNECGYEGNADVNAAFNIAKRSLGKI